MSLVYSFAFFSLLLGGASTGTISKRATNPTVASTSVIGNVADASINRDSCGSSLIGDRALWTCRDSQPYGSNGVPTLPIWSSSASWSDFNLDGTPSTTLYGGGGSMTPYFTYPSDYCSGSTAGSCDDGTRYALWPDSPPLVTSNDGSTVTAYTWIRNYRIAGLSPEVADPSTTLYKLTYSLSTSDKNALPTVSIVNERFWAENSIGYGAYGNLVQDGTAYLFGKTSSGTVALAKVAAGSVEDLSQYQYWVNGAWTSTQPSLNDGTINIQNAGAGGQGTFYYSSYAKSFYWVGQAGFSVSADFYVTTADSLTGPWNSPSKFYSGTNGNYSLGAYSLQAHPDLLPSRSASTNEIYISYTKNDVVGDNVSLYTTPLIHVAWN
ncbi:hypothetical protein GGR57DRAFT_502671 [Xylariaceae sp. FL1272]|nr:hypothetical protein GGR57DRAFT_502671 [Xylariaceae sp. FL1272]